MKLRLTVVKYDAQFHTMELEI